MCGAAQLIDAAARGARHHPTRKQPERQHEADKHRTRDPLAAAGLLCLMLDTAAQAKKEEINVEGFLESLLHTLRLVTRAPIPSTELSSVASQSDRHLRYPP